MSATKRVDSFKPATDIPDLSGKVILITGANTGLGKEVALQLAKHSPIQIWMAARDQTKGQAAVNEVRAQSPGVVVQYLQLDLSSFESVKQAAKTFLSSRNSLDLLYLNAGILGAPAATTDEGYEIHMGVNHMGHALLLKMLTPVLVKGDNEGQSARVVSLASIGYKHARKPLVLDHLKTSDTTEAGYNSLDRYIHSKLANLLYTRAFAQHNPQITTVSVDPGSVATELFVREAGDEAALWLQGRHKGKDAKNHVAQSVGDGAKNPLWAGTSAAVKSGTYYEPIGRDAVEGSGADEEMAQELWNWTQHELEGWYL